MILIKKLMLASLLAIQATLLCAASMEECRFHERFVERYRYNTIGIDYAQIWAIAQGGQNHIFAATTDGLALFDGVRWQQRQPHNDLIIRALHYDKISGRLYSAGVNSFGYWTANNFGEFEYTQLFVNENVRAQSVDFWRIVARESTGELYFQTHTVIYKYDMHTRQVKQLELPSTTIGYSFAVDGNIYIQVGSRLCLFGGDDTLSDVCQITGRVVSMVASGSSTYVAIEHQGIFLMTGDRLTPVDKALNERLSQVKVNSCVPYMGGYLIGTSTSGVIVTDQNWRTIPFSFLDVEISTQTILSMCVETDGDIWLGFNSGIATIDLSSNERYIYGNELGQVEAVLNIDNKMLTATNKGLFEITTNPSTIKQISGSMGPIWNIAKIDSSVFVVSDRGIYEYSKGQVSLVNSGGVIDLTVLGGQGGYCIASHYGGLSLYRYSKGKLEFVSKITGYNTYPNCLKVDKDDNLWFVVTGVGFQRVELSEDKRSVAKSHDYLVPFDSNSSKKALFISNINGNLVLYANNTAYSYDAIKDTIVVNPGVTEILRLCGSDLTCARQYGNRIWYHSSNDIGYLELVSGRAMKHSNIFGRVRHGRVTTRFFMINERMAVGFNNTIGFVDVMGAGKESIAISRIEAFGTNKSRLHDSSQRVFDVPYAMNNIRIYPVSVCRGAMVDYRVLGIDTKWNTIKLDNYITISALPSGSHTIELRPSGIDSPMSGAIMVVKVARPWYISTVAMLIYAAIFVGVIALLRAYYRRSNRIQQHRLTEQQQDLRRRQVESLERENLIRDKQIAELQKDQIKGELRDKDKRLANITMNVIKTNNILNELKGDIVDIQSGDSQSIVRQKVGRIVKKINTQLSNEEAWQKSESYFNAIYDGLLDRLRQQYPTLTKTDLKLCVYIKLNHTTKEIAELMSISTRSIEMARYRLRKKLNLVPNESIEQILK